MRFTITRQKAEQEADQLGLNTHGERERERGTDRNDGRASQQLGEVTTCQVTLPKYPTGQDKTQ